MNIQILQNERDVPMWVSLVCVNKECAAWPVPCTVVGVYNVSVTVNSAWSEKGI
jgi:hypothetical protein